MPDYRTTVLIGAAAIIIVAAFVVGPEMAGADQVLELIRGYRWAPAVVVALFAIATLFVLPVSVIVVVAGMVMGFWGALIWTTIGAMIGAAGAFGLSRWGGEGIRSRLLNRSKLVQKYSDRIDDNELFSVVLLRLIPLLSFGGLSYALGLTRVSTGAFLVGTFFSIIPGNALFIYFGGSLASGEIWKMTLATFLYLSLLGVAWLAQKRLNR